MIKNGLLNNSLPTSCSYLAIMTFDRCFYQYRERLLGGLLRLRHPESRETNHSMTCAGRSERKARTDAGTLKNTTLMRKVYLDDGIHQTNSPTMREMTTHANATWTAGSVSMLATTEEFMMDDRALSTSQRSSGCAVLLCLGGCGCKVGWRNKTCEEGRGALTDQHTR